MTITLGRLRQQYTSNLRTLKVMRDNARMVAPKKYRGYSLEHLERLVSQTQAIVNLSDADLRAHVAGTIFAVEA